MYKYIKGHEVLMEEHMLSATEIAKAYGFYTPNNKPHAKLITKIIADYTKDKENIYEYYYPYSRGIMRVYPHDVYESALLCFNPYLIENQEYKYVCSDGKKIKFKCKKGDR